MHKRYGQTDNEGHSDQHVTNVKHTHSHVHAWAFEDEVIHASALQGTWESHLCTRLLQELLLEN